MTEQRDIFGEKELGKSADVRLLRRIVPFIRPYKLLLTIALILMAAVTVLELAVPYVTKEAIDRYIVPDHAVDRPASVGAAASGPDSQSPQKPAEKRTPEEKQADYQGLNKMALILLVIILLNLAVNFGHVLLMEYTAQSIMHELRLALFSHIQRLSVHFFNTNPVGRLVTRVTNDIQNMHEMLTSVIIFVLKDLFLLIGITAVLFAIDWQLSLAVYIIFPLVFYAGFKFANTARNAYRTLRIKAAEINTKFSETIGGISIIQLFGQEKNNYDDFRRINRENFTAGMRQITVFALFMPFIELMSSVGLAVVIFAGGSGILAGRVSLGELVVFISYLRMFFRPIRDIAEKYNITQNALSSAERIFLILDEDDRLPEPEAGLAAAIPARFTEISGHNLWFGYEPDEPVIRGIDFSVPAGSTLAVVGPTGAGKTSLINLIMRFYDPDAGALRVNGTDIRRFRLSELRSKIALVSQDPFLFSGSILHNIFGANGEPDRQTIDRVLAQSHAGSFINRLPEGIHTRLTEQGATLSSGQRQLISIARAIAADPELIIFDEATSYIDSETETSIQQALTALMAERTAIVIAHRLSTAKIADTILVMHHGRVIESGAHEQLMAADGFYRRMVEIQG
ncbi:MAG: ABC transporter ATP-binding protein [Desulfobacterales bacterium]